MPMSIRVADIFKKIAYSTLEDEDLVDTLHDCGLDIDSLVQSPPHVYWGVIDDCVSNSLASLDRISYAIYHLDFEWTRVCSDIGQITHDLAPYLGAASIGLSLNSAQDAIIQRLTEIRALLLCADARIYEEMDDLKDILIQKREIVKEHYTEVMEALGWPNIDLNEVDAAGFSFDVIEPFALFDHFN